jgi:iron complex outermembrane recepter protein
MKTRSLHFPTVALALTLGVGSANAQSIDYGSLEELFGEAVTTSATGKPQRATDVPVSMEIITADEIRRSGANTIPGILKSVSGMDYMGFGMADEQINMRGYNQRVSSRILVLINGRQVYFNFFGFTAWDSLPVGLDEIRQIEVVKGPNTALFGFNAASGVINIVTYSPVYDDIKKATIGYDNKGAKKVTSTTTFGIGESSGIRLSAGYVERSGAGGVTNPLIDNLGTDAERQFANVDGLFQITDTSQIGVELTYSDSLVPTLTPLGEGTTFDMQTQSVKLNYLANTKFGSLKASAYKNWIDFTDDSDFNPVFDDNLTVVQVELLKKINPSNTIRVAAEYRKSSVYAEFIAITPNPGGTLESNTYSISTLWDSQISDKLSTAVSVRYDTQSMSREGWLPTGFAFTNDVYGDIEHAEFSYNLGAVYKVNGNGTLRAMAAKGIQMPPSLSLNAFVQEPVFGGLSLFPDPFLSPTAITNYEIGYDYTIPSIEGILRASVFYQQNEDLSGFWNMMFGPIPGHAAFGGITHQLGDSDARGFEVELKGQANENINWGINYSYVSVEDELDNTAPGGIHTVSEEFENQSPEHHVNASIGYSDEKWEADVQAYYVSERQVPTLIAIGAGFNMVDVEAQVVVDARIAYKLNENLMFEIKGTGLTSNTYSLTPIAPMERRIMGQIRYSF